ncbi:MAG: GTPase HflX [Candidatus Amoebophilus sp.]
MTAYIETATKQETAVLVSLATLKQPLQKAKEYLAELSLLCYTLNIKPVSTFIQQLDRPQSGTLIGKGKLEEIKTFIQTKEVDKVIFDEELTPSQTRNLERILERPILDRNSIILAIFAMRAKTRQAKIQVELAQYQYLLPRLTKMWSHLSRQKGGFSGMRGPGEKELETDRRIVQDKISLLRKKLESINKQSITQRKTRQDLVRVALVGYTNVGKSTLMHLLSKSDAYVEDKLFATITSTVRRVVINHIPFLLTDTVGFIRKLPHTLIESFKSTLDEIREADILLHVVDASHSACEEHIQVVQQTLHEIGAEHIPTILVFNKMDQLEEENSANEQQPTITMEAIRNKYAEQYGHQAIFISARQQKNIDILKDMLYQQVLNKHLLIYPNYLKSDHQ